MADTTYRVKTHYEVDGSQAEREIDSLASSLKSLHGLAAGFVGALGLSEFASKIFEINGELQKTTITVATMFQAGGFAGLTTSGEDFAKSMGMARAEIQQMRKDARDLPGTFEDLMAVFKGSLVGGNMAGKSIADIEKFASKMMATGVTLGFDSQTIGRDIGMIFAGRLGAHNVMWTQLKKFLKDDKGNPISDAAFKSLDASKQWALLEKGLKGFEPGIKAFGDSWEAVSSTTEDYVKTIFQIGTAPVFDFVSKKLQEWNTYYEKNKEVIDEFVRNMGVKLANAVEVGFGKLQDILGWIVEHKDILLKIAGAFAIGKVTGALGGMKLFGGGVGGFATNLGHLFGGNIGAAQLDASRAAAPTLAHVASGAAFGMMLNELTGSSSPFSMAIAATVGALGTLPGPIGLVSNGLLLLYTGLQKLAAWIDDVHKDNIDRTAEAGRIKAKWEEYTQGGQNYGLMTDQVASSTVAMLRDNKLIGKGGELDSAAAQAYLDNIVDKGSIGPLMRFFALAAEHVQNQKVYGPVDDPIARALNKGGKGTKPAPTTVNVKIIQTIENANDPNRVLVKTREAMEEIFKHPITTPTNRFATVR